MLKKQILIILLLSLHLTLSLKSANFCKLEQKVCKGFYDTKQKYETKCNLVECSKRFSIKCSLNICSNNKTEGNEYRQMNSYVHILLKKHSDLKMTDKYLKEKSSFETFNKHIKKCENKIYNFDPNDFCVSGQNCVEKLVSPTGLGYNYVNRKTDCKCPNELSFKCNKYYCTKDSIACDYYKKNKKNKALFAKINNCNNGNVSFLKSFFNLNFY
jgi:hypothetical protein